MVVVLITSAPLGLASTPGWSVGQPDGHKIVHVRNRLCVPGQKPQVRGGVTGGAPPGTRTPNPLISAFMVADTCQWPWTPLLTCMDGALAPVVPGGHLPLSAGI
jgi:hypothetical protein